MADDLSAPLGQDRKPKRRPALPLALPQAVALLLSLFVVVLAGWAMVMDDPYGGEPMAVVPAELTAANPGKTPDDARPAGQAANERPNRYDGPPADATTPPSAPAGKTVTIIDGSSGKRQEIVIPSIVIPTTGLPGRRTARRAASISGSARPRSTAPFRRSRPTARASPKSMPGR